MQMSSQKIKVMVSILSELHTVAHSPCETNRSFSLNLGSISERVTQSHSTADFKKLSSGDTVVPYVIEGRVEYVFGPPLLSDQFR